MTVLGPVQPAEVLHVASVVDVVLVGSTAGELDFDGFDPLALIHGSGSDAVSLILLPSDVLDMHGILHP